MTTHGLVISEHALERYQLHHPGATGAQVLAELERGVEVSGDMARLLCGRRKPHRRDRRRQAAADRYVLARDRRGLFVVAPDRGGVRRAVTYLRFGSAQEAFARDAWPREAAAQA